MLYLNKRLSTILSKDIYIALWQELCLPSRSEYIGLIAIFLGLPSETINDTLINWQLSHKRVSPLQQML